MDDVQNCPICRNKLKNSYITASLVIRSCADGLNHSLTFTANVNTNKVDKLNLGIGPSYSRYLEVDYINNKSRISFWVDGKPQYMTPDSFVEPDFPDLVKLKEKLSLYVVFG